MFSKRIIIFFLVILMISSGLSISKVNYDSKKIRTADESKPLLIPNSVAGVVIGGDQIGFLPENKNLNVMVTFPFNNQSKLSFLLNSIQNEHSKLYHKFLTASEFERLFSPSSMEYSKYIDYFRKNGLSVTSYQDRVSIGLTGTASQFDSIFNTELVNFHSKNENYFAPNSQLKLSVNYGQILNIVGLNSMIKPSISPMFSGSNSTQILYGSDLQNAYHLKELYQQYGYPTNETIATILWSGTDSSGSSVAPYIPSDLSYYFLHNLPSNEPKPTVYGYPILGAPVPGGSASSDQSSAHLESTLDLEMVGSTAPGAKIVEVYGPSATLSDIDQAFAAILNPSYNATVDNALSKVVAISNSWGTSDTNDTTWMQYEEEAAARGITVLASSGDNGNTNSGAPSFPASMSYNNFGTMAVGGTNTILTGSDSLTGIGTTGIKNQSVWYGSPSSGDGSEGGVSAVFKEPSWQLNSSDSNSIISKYSSVNNVTSGRGTPDVASVAANMSIYVTSGSTSGYMTLWGTSIASPLTAGLIATVDHSIGTPEGFINPLLYKYGQMEFQGILKKPDPFYFIYNGSNAKYSAIKGYNLVVGWGSINAYNFVQDQLPIQVPYTVTFKENGLHSDLVWYVNLSNGMKSGAISPGMDYTFKVYNGTYSYFIGTNNFSFSTTNGSVKIDGSNVSVLVQFVMTYKTSFSETGLPDTVTWYLKINDQLFGPITSSNFSVYLKNGSYSFTINAPSGYVASPYLDSFLINGTPINIKGISFIPYNYPSEYVRNKVKFNITNYLSENISATSTNPALVNFQTKSTQYVVNATSNEPESFGNYTINVKKIEQMLINHEIAKDGGVISFILSGGTSFSYPGVNTQETISTSKYKLLTLQTYTSSQESTLSYNNTIFRDNYPLPTLKLNFSSPGFITISSSYSNSIDGTYSYSKTFQINFNVLYFNSTDTGYSRDIINEYKGWNVEISTLNITSYRVVFNEKGLPYNSFWYVNLTNGIDSGPIGVGSTYVIDLPNGTYNYTTTNTYNSYGAYGMEFSVSETSSNLITINFSNYTYMETFYEKGLGLNSFWYVNFTSGYFSGPIPSGSSYKFILPNGTHGYTFSTSSQFYGSPHEFGNITVLGKGLESTVIFTNKYKVTFNEKGLPSDSVWGVNIDKGIDSGNTSSNTIDFYLLNNSYSFTISNNAGYLSAPVSSVFIVNGSFVTIETILFLPPNSEDQWIDSGLKLNLTNYVSESLHVSNTNPAYVQFLQNYTKFQVNGTSSNPESYGNYTVNINYIDKLLKNNEIIRNDANLSFYLQGGTSFSYGGVTTAETITVGSEKLLTLTTYLNNYKSTLNFNGTVFSSNYGLPTIFLNFSTANKVTIYSSLDNYNGNYYYKETFNLTGKTLYFNTTDNGFSDIGNKYQGWTVGLNPLQLVTHKVTVTEKGLLSNAFWYFNLTNGKNSGPISSGASYTISLINGTYNYFTGTTNNLYSSPNSSFAVKSNNIQITLLFAESFLANFSESGLPKGVHWYLNFTNGFKSGPIQSGSNFSIKLYNGTYSYNLSTTEHQFAPIVPQGKIKVSGHKIDELFYFSYLYQISISENKLPANYLWFANITGGASFSSSKTSLVFTEPNGTYNVTFASNNKVYYSVIREETILVKGHSVSLSITFSTFNYSIIFKEINLPESALWYVNLSNGMKSGEISGSSFSFNLTNGSYQYNIATNNKIYHSNGGSFTVNGATLTESVTFSYYTYLVTFSETGLLSGDLWYVNLSSGAVSGAIDAGSSYSFSLINGTYQYNIATNNKIYHAPASSFTESAGSQSSIPVSFSLYKYSITFTETGLPSIDYWYVNITGQTSSGAIDAGSSYSFSLINGTYQYNIATNNKIYHAPASSFTVNGLISNNDISIAFSKVLYQVTFTESNLPSTELWYVNLSNGMKSGEISGSSFSFNLTNGSYQYNIATNNKIYSPVLHFSSFSIEGMISQKIILFSLVKYKLTFIETGLSLGVTWYINGSMQANTKSSSMTFNLENGSYTYFINNLSSYYSRVIQYIIIINGKNVTETVVYYHYSYISGIISPKVANVTINGKMIRVAPSGSFNTSVVAGTYTVMISEVGYRTYYSNFSLSNGVAKNIDVNLTKIPIRKTSVGNFVIIGIIVAIAVGGAGAIFYIRRKY